MAFVPFDDRDGWIWMDGDFVPWRDAKTHVLTHALHYGSSVFEGERMYGGEIFKLTPHSERLKRSANLLDFDLPYSVAEIDAACKATCAGAGDRTGAAVGANVAHAEGRRRAAGALTRAVRTGLTRGQTRETFFNGLRSFRRS